MADSKAEAEAAKVAAAQAKIAVAAAASAAAQERASAAAAASMAQQAIAAERLAQLQEAGARRAAEAAEQSAARSAAAADRRAQAEARANVAGMAQMSRMLDAKHKADAEVAASAAKAEAVQTKANAQAALAMAKAQAVQAKTAASSKEAAGSQNALGGAMAGAAAQATHCGGVIGMLQGVLAKLGPYGQAAAIAIGAATIAITAFATATISAMAAAIEVTEKLSRMRTVLTALAGSAGGGAQALKIVQDLAKSLPFSTDQVGTWAKSLMAAGFAGQSLKDAIGAIAAASALMGEEGGAAAEKMLKTLQEGGQAAAQLIKTVQAGGRKAATALAEMGLQSKDLAAALGVSEAKFKTMHLSAEQLQKAIEAALQKKGKGPLEEMALTFPVMIAKVKEGFFSLFDKLGPAVKPFMAAVKSLFSEFYKGGSVINALKPAVTSLLTTAFQWATKAVIAIREMVNGFMGATKARGPFAEIGKELRKVYESSKLLFVSLGKAFSAMTAGQSGASTLSKIVTLLDMMVTVINTIIGPTVAAMTAFDVLGESIGGVMGFLSGLAGQAAAAGAAIIDGLLGFDPGAFVAKMAGMASAGLAAFKSMLGIASPSRVMMQMGGHIAAGASEGIDDGAPKAQASMAKMVDPKALKVGGASGGRGGPYVDLRGSTFNGEANESQVRAVWYKVMDEEGIGGPEAAPA